MRVLGFNLNKGTISYCILEGTRLKPSYIIHGQQSFLPQQPRPQLCSSMKLAFEEIISAQKPDVICYRIFLDARSADQISYLVFPLGILNLIAHEKAIECNEFTSMAFTKRALGFKNNKFDACNTIKNSPPSWPNEVKYAALSSWMGLAKDS